MALLMGVLGMTACREEENELTQEDVVGTWDMNGYDGDVEATISGGGVNQTVATTFNTSNPDVKVTFNADGTWTSTGTYTLNVTSNGQTASEMVAEGGLGSGIYSISEGKLLMKGLQTTSDTQVEEIEMSSKSFTADQKLELEGEGTSMVVDPVFGLNVTSKAKVNMLLER